MKRIFAAMLVLMLLLSATCMAEGNPRLAVNGSGTVTVTPDRAMISFGAKKSSTDIAKAQSFVNETLAKAIDKLREMGITDEDIQTDYISIEEDYNYSDSMSEDETRYIVSNTVNVMISDVDNVGSYIDAVFESGINSFSNLRFTVADPTEARARAMKLAVESAKTRAEALAEAAGMKLGALVRISDGDNGYYAADNGVYEKATGAADSFAGLVYNYDLQITASVTMEYELIPIE